MVVSILYLIKSTKNIMADNSGFVLKCGRCKREISPSPLELCGDCEVELRQIYADIFRQQPIQMREIDQFSMDFKSVVFQNIFLNQSYSGNTAAFFGGYNGVGLLSNFFGEKDVVVLDIVPDVLEWWSKIGRDYGFEVLTLEYDAREPVSDEIKEIIVNLDIDLWRTDPPYNCAGMFCFLSRIFYLNDNNSSIFLTVPTGHKWSDLLKHNVWKFLSDSGMKISDVSPYLFSYPHVEGPDSFAWKIDVESLNPLIHNELFESNIYNATPSFANSVLGCKQYDLCRAQREEWDLELESKNRV